MAYNVLELFKEPPSPGAHKSTSALCTEPPPIPPPPASYVPPRPVEPRHLENRHRRRLPDAADMEHRDAMQLWFEARWARLVATRRAREENDDEPIARRLARLERRLTRPLSAEQQAATVAELVQVTAQRDAHRAMLLADRGEMHLGRIAHAVSLPGLLTLAGSAELLLITGDAVQGAASQNSPGRKFHLTRSHST